MSGNPQALVPFTYDKLTGGVNFLAVDANVSEDPQRLEFFSQINFENFRTGSLISQKGNEQINAPASGSFDSSAILGPSIGEYITLTRRYAIYIKASQNAYALDFDTGLETVIYNVPLAGGVPYFVEFKGKVVVFDGVNQPWEWNGTGMGTLLTNTPAAWATQPPFFGAVQVSSLFAFTLNAAYYCAVGNENDWLTVNNAGSFTEEFGDVTKFTAVSKYGTALVLHTALPSIYLISGSDGLINSVDPFRVTPLAANRSATLNSATALIDNYSYFFSSDAILPIVTTDLGVIKFGPGVDLLTKIKTLFQDDFVLPIPQANRFVSPVQCIMKAYYIRNYLVCYFQSIQGGGLFDICGLFDVTNQAWYFRQATPIVAAGTLQQTYLLTGTNDGRILREFVTDNLYDGSVMLRTFKTPWFQWGQTANNKELTHLWLWLTSDASTLQFTINVRVNFEDTIVWTHTNNATTNAAIYNDSSNYNAGPVYAADADGMFHFPVGAEGRAIQIEFISQDASSQVTVRKIVTEVTFLDTQ